MFSESAVRRRARPRVIILDAAFAVFLADARGGAEVRREFIEAAQRVVCEGGDSLEVVVDDAHYVVRVAQLLGELSMRYAVFIEPRGSRQPLIHAYHRFGLTPREVEVLALIVDGASNKEIAKTLSIVEGTVQDHVRSLCAKSGAKRRGDLLAGVFGVDDL